MKKLTYKEMQEMLPDYAFGRLSVDEMSNFEANLDSYPDLKQELIDIQSVFGKVERIDFDNIYETKSRNISVKINQRLEQDSRRKQFFSNARRLIIPSLGLAAILIVTFITFLKKPSNQMLNNFTNKTAEMITKSDVLTLIDSLEDTESIVELSMAVDDNIPKSIEVNLGVIHSESIESIYNDFVNEKILSLKESPDILNEYFESSTDLMKALESLDEEDFQNIIKAIENAEFFS